MGDKKQINSADLFGIVNEGAPKQSTQVSSKNFSQILANAPEQEGLSWWDVPFQAVTNIPKSAYEFGKGMTDVFVHPLKTSQSVMDIAAGTLRNITPKQIADWIDKYDKNPESAERASSVAAQVGKFYKERYGTSEGFKQAVAQDPIGVASDLSTVLSGGAGIAAKVGAPAKAVGAIQKAAEVTNPLLVAGKGVTAVGKPLLGMTTGVGSENIANAAKAGFEGDKEFQAALRGEAPMTQPLDNARHNLSVMRQKRGDAYRSGMVDISNDKSVLDFNDIDQAIAKAKAENRHGSKIKDDIAEQHLLELENEVKDWQLADPAVYHTPEGLDALKQRIGAIVDRIPPNEANANRIGGNIYNSVKGTITRQAPKYSEVMSDYADASESIREIEKALSLGNRASADTALRKLQSLTRNNVNTNYGNRLNLAQQLEMEGGKPFISALSGQALSSPTARGLAGNVENLSALGGVFYDPTMLAALPLQTPRLVGEGLYYGGRAAKGVSQAAKGLGLNPQRANTLADILYVNEQNKEQE